MSNRITPWCATTGKVVTNRIRSLTRGALNAGVVRPLLEEALVITSLCPRLSQGGERWWRMRK